MRDRLKSKYEQALVLIHHLSPVEEPRGFYRITVALDEALVLCTMDELQVLRVEGVERGLIKYRAEPVKSATDKTPSG